MRVLVDGRLLDSAPSGVRDIAVGLIRALRDTAASAGGEVIIAGTSSSSDVRCRPQGFLEVSLPIAALRLKADVILVPRQTRPPVAGVPTVPLFHDVGFVLHPELYPTSRRVVMTNQWAMRAPRAMAVSRFTVREMARAGASSVSSALPFGAIHSFEWEPQQDNRYVLCVAVQEPHKNLVNLIKAWDLIAEPGVQLVICGRRGRASEDISVAISELAPHSRVKVVSNLSDNDYHRLMTGCWAYVQPSYYEGLCIPALDLAAAGVPTATSTTGNLGEVFGAGGARQVFDPTSVEDTARCLDKIVGDATVRDETSAWNRANVKLTSWRAVGEAAWGVLSP